MLSKTTSASLADYQQLVAAAHQQGIKILLDMVPNHVGPKHPWATSQPAPGWLHGTTANHINTDYDYPPVTDPHAVEKNYRSALDGWFANILPDLAQENPLVAQYLLQNAYWWMETGGVDGFRIDTFPYVPRTFWTDVSSGSAIHVSRISSPSARSTTSSRLWSRISPEARKASTASTPTSTLRSISL